MASMLQSDYVSAELHALYRDQRASERADIDGRVVDRAAWRRSIDRRAERIRVLERTLARMEREEAEAAP